MPRVLALVSVLVVVAMGGAHAVAAQDATPMASPTTGTCDAPELPPGTPTPMEETAGTPAAGMEGTPDPQAAGATVATEAAMEASPAAAEIPTGTPADEATADRVEAALRNVVNCINNGEYLAFAALVTEDGLMEEFGTTNPYDIPMFLEGVPPITIVSVSDVQVHDDGRFSADVETTFGAQLQRERIFFVEQDEFLLFDVSPDLPVAAPAGAATVNVTLGDFVFELSTDTVPAGDVHFDGTNAGGYSHEIVVVKFPEGVEFSMEMMESEEPPEGTQFLGGSAGPPGAEVDLVLLGLEPGTYTLLCFVEEPDGVPHVAKGMVATLTVE